MTIGPTHGTHQDILRSFQAMASLRENVVFKLSKEKHDTCDSIELSMGMSQDMDEALQCGTDELRIGTGVFGSRSYPYKGSDDKDGSENTTPNNLPSVKQTACASQKVTPSLST